MESGRQKRSVDEAYERIDMAEHEPVSDIGGGREKRSLDEANEHIEEADGWLENEPDANAESERQKRQLEPSKGMESEPVASV